MTASHEQRPTHRFSQRAADYVLYRPSYPPDVLAWLRATIGFVPSWKVADVGSGTGIFARLLLDNGNRVYAVEPNDAMRAHAEATLSGNPNFISIAGTAEVTTLPDQSVDLVSAAQAFHWFDPETTRREFERILVPGGHALILFNSRRHDDSAFMRAYDELLRTSAVDYRAVDHQLVGPERLRAFLGDYRGWRMSFSVTHDLDGVVGLSGSSSYTPAPGHPDHDAFYAALRDLFTAHQRDGSVEFLYETEAYLGQLS